MGRDLIKASAIRAQISQIEKFQTATNTFRSKYGYFPGDIPSSEATSLGLTARGTKRGQGDGNGFIEGDCFNTSAGCTNPAIAMAGFQGSGESTVFWVDLSFTNMIGEKLSTAACCNATSLGIVDYTTTPATKDFFPKAKLGDGYYILVTNGQKLGGTASIYERVNFFTLAGEISFYNSRETTALPDVPVMDAFQMDTKIDDGLPQSGSVLALKLTTSNVNNGYMTWVGTTSTAATAASSSTCYDNGNVAGTQKYSVGVDEGNNKTCSLAFKFQ